jgi:hypothetical protein
MVFENRVLRRTLKPMSSEATGEWRKLHNEELSSLYSSPNIIRVIKSRRMEWVGHVARIDERRYAYRFLVGKPEGKITLEDPDVEGKIILKWIFGKWNRGHGLN